MKPKSITRAAFTATLTGLLGLSLMVCPAVAQAPSDIRIALVIGNSAYAGNLALANPSNDAKDMAATLRNMGFGVIEVEDASRTQMMDAIDRVNKQLNGKQGVGMLFYAGHGLQLDWHNYMVPVDFNVKTAKDVPVQTVDIEAVMKSFKSANTRMNIIVLDACRDNPFEGKAASGKGLAPVDAPTGTFLAYATAPGNVAQDGEAGSKNGLYTGYLLKELQKPNASIENVFKRVRYAVRQASNGSQIPWETTSLEDDFVFNSGIKKTTTLSEEASNKQFEIEKADWDKIKASKNADDFYAYLLKYPSGFISEQAKFALEQLAVAKVVAQVEKGGVMQNPLEKRFRVGDSYEFSIRDALTGKEIKRSVSKIDSIQNGLVRMKGTQSDGVQTDSVQTEDGATIKAYNSNNVIEFDPPLPFQPGDYFQVGKKWISKSNQTENNRAKFTRTEEVEVAAFEDVEVPAGKFKAYKVVSRGTLGNGARTKNTFWFEPGWGNSIKRIREVYKSGGGYAIYETYELVSRTRGAG